MKRAESGSGSDSDSEDSDKEIVVRQLPVRQVRSFPDQEQQPDRGTSKSLPLRLEPHPTRSSEHTVSLINPKNLEGETRFDEDEKTHTPGSALSTFSTFSVKEDDLQVIMRSIPDYGQFADAQGIDNDRYLRSALHSMSEELLDYKDDNGNTLLSIACQFSCTELVQILLKRGADARIVNTAGANGLHFACYRDSLSIRIAELLIENNIPVNVAENLYGCTPLHYAASAGDLTLCKLLIQHGAYIHAHDYDNCTSIDYAKDAGMFEVADYLTHEMNMSHKKPTRITQLFDLNNMHSAAGAASQSQTNDASSRIHHGRAPSPSTANPDRYGTSINNASTAAATPAATPQRFVVNNKSFSFDEETEDIKARDRCHGERHTGAATRAPRTVYDFIDPPSVHQTDAFLRSSPAGSVGGIGAKGSPGAGGSEHSHSSVSSVNVSAQSSPGIGIVTSSSPNNNSNPNPAHYNHAPTAKRALQPTTASPYKPLSPSPVNAAASSSKNGAAKGFFIATDDVGGDSGPNTVTSSHNAYYQSQPLSVSKPQSQVQAQFSSNGAHSRHSDAPPLPTPTYNSPDGRYMEMDGCADLSSDKFEIYIERAKFNAKLAKERALNKDVLSSKEAHIRTLQAEVGALKRTVLTYKVSQLSSLLAYYIHINVCVMSFSFPFVFPAQEEVHALNAKLDLMQLPFIETTNALQEELSALRAENKQLRVQLSGKLV